MQKENEEHKEMILNIIHRINDCWLNKQYDKIGDYISENVIVASPGTNKRMLGCTIYVQSYREYDRAVITKDFKAGDPEIDVVEDTAVALCPSFVVYEMNGKEYREQVRETLVFSRISGEWKIVWRTMQTENV